MFAGRRSRAPARADGDRRHPVARAPAVAPRARARDARDRGLGGRRRRWRPGCCSGRGPYCRRLRRSAATSASSGARPCAAPCSSAAFRGWNDGAQGASLADELPRAGLGGASASRTSTPRSSTTSRPTRPHVALEDGHHAPDRLARDGLLPRSAFREPERDAVLMLGIEPNLRWRTFCDEIVELAADLGVELVVTLGALLADVPHTRPAPVTGSASDPEARRGARPRRVALRGADRDRRRPPRRLPERRPLRPRASGRRCRTTRRWRRARGPRSRSASGWPGSLGTEFDLGRPRARRRRPTSSRSAKPSSADEETEAYVQELETRRDALGDELDVPSGDSLAAELTRFLREHEARARRRRGRRGRGLAVAPPRRRPRWHRARLGLLLGPFGALLALVSLPSAALPSAARPSASACAAAAVTCRSAAWARGGCPRARWRPPESSRAARACGRSAAVRSACRPRPTRAARPPRGSAARARR